MAVTGEKDVAAMARQITQVTQRDGWKSDKSVVPDMQRLLGKLTTLKVDKDLLQRTKIGAAVNKLKKHDDEIVRGYSQSLTKKWKNEVGIASSSSSSSRPPERQRVPSPSPPKPNSGDQKRLESARKRLQEGYASERAKRDSRTVQVLSGPIAKGRRGTTVSTAPSRSSIGRAQLAQRRPLSSANHRAASAPPVARRVLPASRLQQQARRPATSLANMSAEERHRQRQLKYRALSGQPGNGSDSGRREPERARISSSSTQQMAERELAMLDKMYPRVCGVGTASTASNSSGGVKKKTSTAARRKEVNYTEGQREVLSWLKGLSVDMSEYAPAFFENGFDSVKLLSTIEKSDLPSLVPKKGHHRLIQQALNDLRHKHSTSAASQRRDHFQKESRVRRRDPFEDEDSDDSFVVSDDGEYRPGHIAAMFRKNRKRQYSYDSDDSINMEASFDEIQKEEKRSTKTSRGHAQQEDAQEEEKLRSAQLFTLQLAKDRLENCKCQKRASASRNVPTKNERERARRAAVALSAVAFTSLAVSSRQGETDRSAPLPFNPEEFLYPTIQPFNTGCGNPYGKPVIMVHGGPGAGCSVSMRRYHDPRVYRIILLDQRGSGRSKPHASLENNTTWHLVEDMEKLRRHLGIEKLVLRGIFHLRKQEIDFYYQHGANFIYPDRWEAYRDAIPRTSVETLRLTSEDPKVRIPAALAWTTWEKTTSNLIPPSNAADKSMDEEKFAEAFARIENHYFVNKGFFPNDEFLNENTYKIRHIPTTAGHSAMEPGIAKELVEATNKFKNL
ncbi:Alpha/Beta hydrolase fold [Phytophthora cactorum]|nr:Alpha/Beta hydrolase fold [Phytophthora cactorum]